MLALVGIRRKPQLEEAYGPQAESGSHLMRPALPCLVANPKPNEVPRRFMFYLLPERVRE